MNGRANGVRGTGNNSWMPSFAGVGCTQKSIRGSSRTEMTVMERIVTDRKAMKIPREKASRTRLPARVGQPAHRESISLGQNGSWRTFSRLLRNPHRLKAANVKDGRSERFETAYIEIILPFSCCDPNAFCILLVDET